MWELVHKEGWAPKNWFFRTMVLEKAAESPLDNKIKAVNPKWNQLWIFIGRADAEAEAPVLWPLDVKSRLIGKDPDAGKDRRQKEKGWQRMRWWDSITGSMDMNVRKLQEIEGRGGWRAIVHGVLKRRTRLSDWTTTSCCNKSSQMRWLKATQIYYLTVLEIRSLKWVSLGKKIQVSAGLCSFWSLEGKLVSLPFPALRGGWVLVLWLLVPFQLKASDCIPLTSASVVTISSLILCLLSSLWLH